MFYGSLKKKHIWVERECCLHMRAEDKGSVFFQIVGMQLTDYTVSQPQMTTVWSFTTMNISDLIQFNSFSQFLYICCKIFSG
jgi:hypothetical protein